MEQEREEECKFGLGLSIGISSSHHHHHDHNHKLHILFPPRPRSSKEEEEGEEHQQQQQQQQQEEEEEEIIKRRFVDDRDEEDKGGARKKLRLSQEQATLLEDTFREHNTLRSFQKQELAEKLNLSARQVEVWFQNRRARNKLKQTEVDFQMLRKWCETLNEENRRLKKELQELKLTKQPDGSALYLDLPEKASGAAMGLCPSCGGRSPTAGGSKKSNSGDSSIAC